MPDENNVLEELTNPFYTKKDEVTLAKLDKEVEDTDFSMVEVLGNGDFLSPQEIEQKTRSLLAERKKQVMLTLDGKKLQEALKIIDGMQAYSEILFDPDVMDRVKGNIKTSMDLKFLSDAYKTMSDKLQMLMRLDTIDSDGTAGEINLAIHYKTASGNEVSVGLSTK